MRNQLEEYMEEEQESEGLVLPWWEKPFLDFNQASEYFNIGVNKLYSMAQDSNCTFVLNIGSGKKLIKKEKLEQYLIERSSI